MTADLHYFSADDLKDLSVLAEKVKGLSVWYGARIVVEAWSKNDKQPIAWVECHPEDGAPIVRFAPEPDDKEGPHD
jgi:hypothetical protein